MSVPFSAEPAQTGVLGPARKQAHARVEHGHSARRGKDGVEIGLAGGCHRGFLPPSDTSSIRGFAGDHMGCPGWNEGRSALKPNCDQGQVSVIVSAGQPLYLVPAVLPSRRALVLFSPLAEK
ncbi:hypothetical protein ACU639_04325 [Streptomyces cynarae]|uniref:hypothetical protein n=1 Tax=Streptomyces cynarae TaxID=2981134 RepID=UPI00406CA2B3